MSPFSKAVSATILVVDDDASLRKALSVLLRAGGHTIHEAASVAEGHDALKKYQPDLVLTDLCLGDDSGLEIVREVKENYASTETILLTAHGTIENAVEAIQLGAFDYLTKPFANDQLKLRVQKALERKYMREELTRLREHVAMSYGFDNIVGISKKLDILKATARRVAPTDITVLITGPSGTGKELFARAIHHHSKRREKAFVAIDCSAIPEALLESELFGHVKGSFTSAHQNKQGLFEAADGGTVFLDELSNMPQSVQVKLLRFLQDSIIRPVGAQESRKVDVRIVAATNRDLTELIATGDFREDLYYRLNVIPLKLPALTERAEDIEILTEYFIRKICSEMGRETMTITRAAVDKLRRHSWPGNIRELENTLKRAIALASGHELDAPDMMFITNDAPARSGSAIPTETEHRTLTIKGRRMDSTQRQAILRALDENDWNYTRTAEDLGIGRTTLWRKIKKYDLKRETVEG